MPEAPSDWYYVIRGEKRLGPFTLVELREGLERGEFSEDDEVQHEGSSTTTNLKRTLIFKRTVPLEPRREPLKRPPSPEARHESAKGASAPQSKAEPILFNVPPFLPDTTRRFLPLKIGYWICHIAAIILLGVGLSLIFMGLFLPDTSGLGSLSLHSDGGVQLINRGIQLAKILSGLNLVIAAVPIWIMGHVLLCLRAIEHNGRRQATAAEWLASREWATIANERRTPKPRPAE